VCRYFEEAWTPDLSVLTPSGKAIGGSEYKPTGQHANADSLSCLPLKVVEQPSDETVVFNIAQIDNSTTSGCGN